MKPCLGVATMLQLLVCAQLGAVQTDPSDRTADLPDSWLVLYNLNDQTSVQWKDWYTYQWGIPPENALGLNASVEERVQRDHFHDRIFYPVQDYLDGHPELKARIMGILVGYRVPGNYYLDSTHPPYQGGGGWSVSSSLQDLRYTTWYKRSNPHHFVAYWQPGERLTKATLAADCYMTARLDAPTVTDVGELTTRARAITGATGPLPATESLYYDYLDIGAAAGDEWELLRRTVESENLTIPAWRFPWVEFESENEATSACTMRFSYYRLTGWQTVPWGGSPLGTRIVAYALNSYGATTVRSTTALSGRFVPNALVNGRFAAALGATAEPFLGNEPQPDTIVWCLAQGWTLGEACFRANPFMNYMWEVVGDPLLRVPHWFADAPPNPPANLGPPASVNGSAIIDTTPSLEFTQSDPTAEDLLAFRIQIDDSATFESPIVDYTSALLAQGAAGFTVGQAAAGGCYVVGGQGQGLLPGAYYWRVRSNDGASTGAWVVANGGEAAFVVVEPLAIVSAVSRKAHGQRGVFDLALSLNPSGPATVECRDGGPTTVVLTFNAPVTVTDGVPDGTEVSLSAGQLAGVSLNGPEVAITLSGVPNQTCLTITVAGLISPSGGTLSGDTRVHIGALRADTNNDRQVDQLDCAQVRAYNGMPLNASSARLDLNLDGEVNLIDGALAKEANGRSVTCP